MKKIVYKQKISILLTIILYQNISTIWDLSFVLSYLHIYSQYAKAITFFAKFSSTHSLNDHNFCPYGYRYVQKQYLQISLHKLSKNAMTFSLRKNLKFLWPCICVGNFFVTKHVLHAKWLFKEKWGVIKKSHNITIIFLHNSQGWLDIKHEWKRCCDSKPCPCLRLLPHFEVGFNSLYLFSELS